MTLENGKLDIIKKQFIQYLEARKGFLIFMYMKKVEKIIVTQEEIRMATRPNIYRNKKKYSRKGKARDAWRSEE